MPVVRGFLEKAARISTEPANNIDYNGRMALYQFSDLFAESKPALVEYLGVARF